MNLDHARSAGSMARERGRGIDTCPLYAMGQMGWVWQRAWMAGWKAKDAEVRRA